MSAILVLSNFRLQTKSWDMHLYTITFDFGDFLFFICFAHSIATEMETPENKAKERLEIKDDSSEGAFKNVNLHMPTHRSRPGIDDPSVNWDLELKPRRA